MINLLLLIFLSIIIFLFIHKLFIYFLFRNLEEDCDCGFVACEKCSKEYSKIDKELEKEDEY